MKHPIGASIVVSCLASCAVAPGSLCGTYVSPPRVIELENAGEDYQASQYLSLSDDWSCCLGGANGLYPIGHWRLDLLEEGSRRILVWPVGKGSFGDPTPPSEFLVFDVMHQDGHYALARNDEVWTRLPSAK